MITKHISHWLFFNFFSLIWVFCRKVSTCHGAMTCMEGQDNCASCFSLSTLWILYGSKVLRPLGTAASAFVLQATPLAILIRSLFFREQWYLSLKEKMISLNLFLLECINSTWHCISLWYGVIHFDHIHRPLLFLVPFHPQGSLSHSQLVKTTVVRTDPPGMVLQSQLLSRLRLEDCKFKAHLKYRMDSVSREDVKRGQNIELGGKHLPRTHKALGSGSRFHSQYFSLKNFF